MSTTSERLATISSENRGMLADMQTFNLKVAEMEALRDENSLLMAKIDGLERENTKLLSNPNERLLAAKKESQELIDKWTVSEDARAEIEAKYASLQTQLTLLEKEKSELLAVEEVSKEMRTRVKELESEYSHTKEEYARVEKQLDLALRECELVKAIMLHEKNTWAMEKRAIEEGGRKEAKIAVPGKKAMQKRPSVLSSDGDAGVFDETKTPVGSIIVAEMAELKGRIDEGQALLTQVQHENSRLIGLVEHERKTTVLLQAELDALPDYIFLYHQERKVSFFSLYQFRH